MRFSQRIGKAPNSKQIQIESIDSDLRNSLWNAIELFVIDEIGPYTREGERLYEAFCKLIWYKFYKEPVNKIPYEKYKKTSYIRDRFFKDEWFVVYDFIEFLADVEDFDYDTEAFRIEINSIMEKEFSAYRFINNKIVPISNGLEISEIKQSLSYTPFSGANIHITKAIEMLSDRINPDYRNSIKESISAVEATCRELTGESTLGKALNAFETKGIRIDSQLKSGFEKIYAFTNNKQSGIRHAIIEDHTDPDFNDAKYMLVVCSSFINYLAGKQIIA